MIALQRPDKGVFIEFACVTTWVQSSCDFLPLWQSGVPDSENGVCESEYSCDEEKDKSANQGYERPISEEHDDI